MGDTALRLASSHGLKRCMLRLTLLGARRGRGRLTGIAAALKVPPAFFFAQTKPDSAAANKGREFFANDGARRLLAAFDRIPSTEARAARSSSWSRTLQRAMPPLESRCLMPTHFFDWGSNYRSS
jgi:hypothetical protein